MVAPELYSSEPNAGLLLYVIVLPVQLVELTAYARMLAEPVVCIQILKVALAGAWGMPDTLNFR